MTKKRVMFLSLSLLCSGGLQLYAENAAPAVTAKHAAEQLAAAATPGSSSATPSAKTSSSKRGVLDELVTDALTTAGSVVAEAASAATTFSEEKAAQLAALAQQEMSALARTVANGLAQARSFGQAELNAVKVAIAKYGDPADRAAAVDAVITQVEAQARTLYAQAAELSGSELTALETTQIASIQSVKSGLVLAKADLISGVQQAEAKVHTIFGLIPASGTTCRQAAEAGAVAAVVLAGGLAYKVFHG